VLLPYAVPYTAAVAAPQDALEWALHVQELLLQQSQL
jgi:hypothetical protein